MTIRDSFCPKCGKPSRVSDDGLCTGCRIGKTPWFTCTPRVQHVHCPSCGAMKQVNTWTDSEMDKSDIAPELAKSAVHFHPDLKKPSISVTIHDLTVNRSRADMTVRGTLYNSPVEGTCSAEILWHKEQCDRCNRISGSYYEGVVQVRAEGRLPSRHEVRMAATIAQQVEDSLQSGGERLSFISDINQIHDGIDIIVGSQHIGMLIAKTITGKLGGRCTTHPKLVGEKNGRQLFRVTYSVKLPRYQQYDVVRVKKRYYQVERVESNILRATDLGDGSSRTVREDDVERVIGNSRSTESALVVFADGKTMGIMDPDSCRTEEFRQPAWMYIEAGMKLRILRDENQMVVVG